MLRRLGLALLAYPLVVASAPPGDIPDARARFFEKDKLRVLLLSGRNNHDWRTTTPLLRQLLVDTGRFAVRVVEEPAGLTAETLAVYDLVVSDYCGPRWGPSTEQALVDFVRSGRGLVAVHGAAYGFSGHDVLADRHERTGITEPPWKEHAEMVGGWWPTAPSKQFHGARHSFRVRFVDREHPVSKGLGEGFVATDELYHQMTILPSAHVLATAWSDPATGGTGKDEPILWVNTFGRGRAYFSGLGHEVAAMQNEGFAAALLRGAEWAATGAVTLPPDAGVAKARPDALRVLVVTGGHDYPTSFYTVFEGRREWLWSHAASNEEAFASEIVSRFDVLVLYDFSQKLGPEGRDHLRAFAESGKGIVVLHHAIADYQDWPWFEELVGGRYLLKADGEWKASTYRHDVELFVKPAGSHPIVEPVGPLQLLDETYKGMRISPKVAPLLEIDHPDGDRYVGWVSPFEASKVVYLQLGHDQHAHRSAAYRDLVRNAILWSAGR
jgi:type 1 glutamine amidotransferase